MTETRSAMARRSSARPGGASSRAGSRGSAAARTSSGAGGPGRPDRAEAGSWPVRERSLIGPVLGIPPLAAVALAVGLTAVGVLIDLVRLGTVGTVFQIGYGVGCLLAVAWVRRRSIFLPAIQPPLLLAVVVPALAVLVGAPSSTAGVTEHLLLAGAPLINAFPAMAVTTVLVLLVAGLRLLRQRTGPDDAVGSLRSRLSGRAPEPADPTTPDGTDRPGRAAGSGRAESGRAEPGRARSGGPSSTGASPGRTTRGRASAETSSAGTSGSPSSKNRGTGGRAASGAGASGTGSRARTSSARTRSADRRTARPDADDGGDRTGGTARSSGDPSSRGRSASGRDRASGRGSGRSGTDGDGPRTRRSPRDTS